LPKDESIVEQMKRVPGVIAVGLTDIGIATDNSSNTGLIPPGSNKMVSIGEYGVDEGFKDAMGVKLLAGRWFDRTRPMDDMTFDFPIQKSQEIAYAQRGVNVVMNAYAVKKLGFKSPQDAVGKVVRSQLFEAG